MRCALVLVAVVLVVSTKGARVLGDKGDMFTSVKRVSTKRKARLLAISLQVFMIYHVNVMQIILKYFFSGCVYVCLYTSI